MTEPEILTIGKLAREAGVRVVPVPGPSALTTLLSVSPVPAPDVRFAGFLPSRRAARRARLKTLLAESPVVFFEAPHRMQAALEDLHELAPGRALFVGREMTKRFEQFYLGSAAEVLDQLQAADAFRGEFACQVEHDVLGSRPATELAF